ncbi:hypothetical protein THAOC_11901, partial [Thalassiosira oceanica]
MSIAPGRRLRLFPGHGFLVTRAMSSSNPPSPFTVTAPTRPTADDRSKRRRSRRRRRWGRQDAGGGPRPRLRRRSTQARREVRRTVQPEGVPRGLRHGEQLPDLRARGVRVGGRDEGVRPRGDDDGRGRRPGSATARAGGG